MDNCIENVVEFLRGERTAAVMFSQGKYKSKIKRLSEERPNPTKLLTEEQRKEIAERLNRK